MVPGSRTHSGAPNQSGSDESSNRASSEQGDAGAWLRHSNGRVESRSGVFFALAAFTSWGLLPVYWKSLASVPAPEILMHRVAGTVVFAALLLTLSRRWDEVRASLRSRRTCSRSPRRRC